MHIAPRRPILVAEDNAISRELLMHQLRMLGRDAVAVADGEAAIRAWREGDFALLVTDLEMPGLNGYELASLIRSGATRPDAPIVLLTAGDAAEDEPCAAAAVNDILTKPAGLAALRAVLEKWLGPALPVVPAAAVAP
jgi:CheY-like chemotaxis protein